MPVSYDFSGKTAVVTGGSKGIGRAICYQLKQSGAQVWNWDLSPIPHDGVSFEQVDVVDGRQIDAAISKLGRIDILVNNAGLLGPPVSVEQLQSADWRRVLDVNLTSVFEVCRRVVPLMRRSGWGRIVNMASVAAKEGFTNLSAYSSASAGVVAFTKALGKELANTAIRVNVVAPAAIDTDLIRQFSPDAINAMIARTPLNRLGTVEEVARLVAWLCSDDCSFSTGAVFDLSGGRATY
jgi:NAD(P)-dependent dehydrogenase (short-subunit alcohol dehydrogenase family)